MAISSPLMEESIDGATGMLLNFTGSDDLNLFEVNEAADIAVSTADKSANIIFGTVIDPTLGDEVRVTVIATGFDRADPAPAVPAFTTEQPTRRRAAEPRGRGPVMDDRQRSSLEIPDDDIDIPSFLKE